MNPSWSVLTVAQLQERGCLLVEDGNHGEYRPRQQEFGDGPTAYIRATDMSDGRVLFESAQRITDGALARIRKGIGRGGDILFSHKGTVGKLAPVPLDAPPFVCSPQTTLWRTLDESVLNRRFLYCLMRSRGFSEQWRAVKGETDMADYVSLTAQRRFRLAIPPIEEQHAIAQVLGAIDDKIELNHQMNRTIDAIAQTLFRSWFVDFDPVAARAAGRIPSALSQEVAELFPASFAKSRIGDIPAGWRVSEIGRETRVVGGSTPSTSAAGFWDGGTISWLTPRDLAKLTDPVVLETERRITAEGLGQISSGLLPKGTVLLSSRAPIGYTAIAEIPLSVNQGFVAMVCEREVGSQYVLGWTRENMDEITARAGGTTFDEINRRSFRPIPLLVPDPSVMRVFEETVSRLHERIVANLRESQSLARLHDLLLPMLLSGALRARSVDRPAGNVA